MEQVVSKPESLRERVLAVTNPEVWAQQLLDLAAQPGVQTSDEAVRRALTYLDIQLRKLRALATSYPEDVDDRFLTRDLLLWYLDGNSEWEVLNDQLHRQHRSRGPVDAYVYYTELISGSLLMAVNELIHFRVSPKDQAQAA